MMSDIAMLRHPRFIIDFRVTTYLAHLCYRVPMVVPATEPKLPLLRWLIWSGLPGLGVSALIIAGGCLGHPLPGALILWPTGIYGLNFNNDLSGALHAIPVMFGGQFLLYGFVGLTVRLLVHLLRRI